MKPFFSIIVPAYNAEMYLDRCVDSIINQNFDQYEIVIIDDGSIDSTSKIAKQLMNKHSNIRLVTKENGGVASARNQGIKHSQGEYLVFLDADDELSSNSLIDAYNGIKKYDLPDVLVCDTYVEKTSKGEFVNCLFKDINYQDLSVTQTKMSVQNISSMCIGIYNRNFLLMNDLFVKEKITIGEDTDFFFRCLLKSKDIHIISCNLFVYNENSMSVTHNISYQNIKDILSVCIDRTKDLLGNSYNDIDFDKAMNFFASKFIHFGIKSVDCDRCQKDELIRLMKTNRYILSYVKSKPDRVYSLLVGILGEHFACCIFNSLVKIRNKVFSGE